jgi:hypothetical protein
LEPFWSFWEQGQSTIIASWNLCCRIGRRKCCRCDGRHRGHSARSRWGGRRSDMSAATRLYAEALRSGPQGSQGYLADDDCRNLCSDAVDARVREGFAWYVRPDCRAIFIELFTGYPMPSPSATASVLTTKRTTWSVVGPFRSVDDGTRCSD